MYKKGNHASSFDRKKLKMKDYVILTDAYADNSESISTKIC